MSTLSTYVKAPTQLSLQGLDDDNRPVGPTVQFPADFLDAERVNGLDLDAAVDAWQRHVQAADPELLIGELPIDRRRPERVLLIHGRLFRAQLMEGGRR